MAASSHTPVTDSHLPAADSAGDGGVVDVDVHNWPAARDGAALGALYPYLPEHWRDYLDATRFPGPDVSDYPPGTPVAARPGTTPQSGAPPGSEAELVRRQVLDEPAAALAILDCAYRVQSVHNGDLAVALARAINDWQVAEWLDPEPRFRASLVVPSQYPAFAAEEIERLGAHPGFVQVALPVRSAIPYGNRIYDPLLAAADRHSLVLGINFGGAPGNPPTPSGWPSTYLEELVGMGQVAQSQLLSLITEGAFSRYPQLRVAFLECGVSWLAAFLWRADKEWKGLRHTIPWVKRPPSHYVRDHVRLSGAPFDAPPEQAQLAEVLEQLGGVELLLYASDYPHDHGEQGIARVLELVGDDERRAVLAGNARAFYALDAGSGGDRR